MKNGDIIKIRESKISELGRLGEKLRDKRLVVTAVAFDAALGKSRIVAYEGEEFPPVIINEDCAEVVSDIEADVFSSCAEACEDRRA